MKIFLAISTCLFAFTSLSFAQQARIPSSYSNVYYDDHGLLYFEKGGERFYADTTKAVTGLGLMMEKPQGTDNGIRLDFDTLKGSITYGLVPYGKRLHPSTVFRVTTKLQNGKAVLNLKTALADSYEMPE